MPVTAGPSRELARGRPRGLARGLVRVAGLLALVGGSLVGAVLPGGAARALTTPALVVDVDSGRVLYAERATDPWYPASITKLMTTYVALDQVRQGRASLDGLITISERAASEPPSKMGFKPGTQLTLDNALKIIMVKSANDIAWAIGENLGGGSVEGFAGLMNETAARLGMRDSHWYNPNGLPDERQWTSARDMAILGRALLRDFPDSRDLFSISAIQFGRRVMANHNGLLGRYAGVDGMKTGFICSGGFNVVASATRGGRRIITVVMGSPNARERTLKAADLFDYGFGQSGGLFAQRLEDLPTSARAAPPDLRPVICDRRKPPPEEDAEPAVTAGAAAAGGSADNANAQLMTTGAPPGSPPAAALAFAAMNAASWKTRALPPRAPLQPVLVWIGRDPAEGAVAADAATADDETPKGRGRRKLAARGAPEEAPPAKAAPAAPAAPRPSLARKTPKAGPKAGPARAAKPAATRQGKLRPLPSVKTTPVIADEAPATRRREASAKPAAKPAKAAPVRRSAKPAAADDE